MTIYELWMSLRSALLKKLKEFLLFRILYPLSPEPFTLSLFSMHRSAAVYQQRLTGDEIAFGRCEE
jgi:hypothetical protein